MRLIHFLLALLLFTGLNVMTAYAAESLSNPDPSAVLFLQYKYAHTAPPFEALAQRGLGSKSGDEFHKQDEIKQAAAVLKAKAASLDGVKTVTVSLMSAFSDYDFQFQEYDFDINDGSYLPFNNVLGREVRIALTNGTKAQTWKLGPKDAEDVLRKNKGQRAVTLVLTLLLLDSTPAGEGEQITLNAKVLSYDIMTAYGSGRLGKVVVEASP